MRSIIIVQPARRSPRPSPIAQSATERTGQLGAFALAARATLVNHVCKQLACIYEARALGPKSRVRRKSSSEASLASR